MFSIYSVFLQTREATLRFAGFVGFSVVVSGLIHVFFTRHRVTADTFYYIYLSVYICYGLFQGVTSSTLESLFADSIPSGNRSRTYTFRSMLRTGGNALGPLCAVIIFLSMTNDWTDYELRIVMSVGFCAFSAPCLILFCFRESSTLGLESESLLIQDPDKLFSNESEENSILGNQAPSEVVISDEIERDLADEDNSEDSSDDEDVPATYKCCCCNIRSSYIPALVATSDMLSMLGSGITIRFFPLFFWRKVGLKPVEVNAVYVAGPLGISVCSYLAQKASLRVGRPQVAFICRVMAAGILVGLIFIGGNKPLLIAMYLLRTWSANCTAGLSRSVLNDYVTKAARARYATRCLTFPLHGF